MKKVILLLMFAFTGLTSQSQTYHPFPTTTASWMYRYYDDFHAPTGCFIGFKMNGDTIINTFTYKKIYSNTYGDCWSYPACTLYGYVGCIREIGKKIFYVPDTTSNEYLLHDFNVPVGDTIFNAYPNDTNSYCNNDTLIVQMVDSVLCSNGYHKTYYVGPVYAQIIEGIGILGGWCGMFSPAYCGSVSGGYGLFSLCDDTGNIYPGTTSGPCSYPVGISETKKETFIISPNPFKDEIQIENNLVNDNLHIRILNILGEEISSTNSSNSKISVNTSGLSEGIYFVEIKSKSGLEFKKVIKQ